MDMLRLFAVSATISTVLVLVLALLSLPPAPAAPAAQSDLSGYVERHYVAVLEVGKYPRPH